MKVFCATLLSVVAAAPADPLIVVGLGAGGSSALGALSSSLANKESADVAAGMHVLDAAYSSALSSARARIAGASFLRNTVDVKALTSAGPGPRSAAAIEQLYGSIASGEAKAAHQYAAEFDAITDVLVNEFHRLTRHSFVETTTGAGLGNYGIAIKTDSSLGVGSAYSVVNAGESASSALEGHFLTLAQQLIDAELALIEQTLG